MDHGRHVQRSRTSSTSSLRSPSALGSGVPPATPSHTPNTLGRNSGHSAGLSAAAAAASSSGFGFNNVNPDQLAAGLFRVRAEQASRASSIPPTPAPTPNPLLQVNHHMVPEQLGMFFYNLLDDMYFRVKERGKQIFFFFSGWNKKDSRRRRLHWLDKLSSYSSTFAILSKSWPSDCF